MALEISRIIPMSDQKIVFVIYRFIENIVYRVISLTRCI